MEQCIITKSIKENLKLLSEFTATPGNGVTRLPFTEEAFRASQFLKGQMEALGLEVRIDNSGAIIGRLQGKLDKTIIIGSHYDSVSNGGEFDGIAGVVCGIEVAKLFMNNKIVPKYSLEIIATNDEEGERFNSGFLSSKAMFGEVTIDNILELKDKDNISIYEAMKKYGIEPREIVQAQRKIEDIKAFIEIHIEQGRILYTNKNHIGIVKTIVGMKRGFLTIKGREDHAGTTPMDMRIDAMNIAANIISAVSIIAKKYKDSVATVGRIGVHPNTINTIAKKAKFSLDIRSTNIEYVEKIYEEIINYTESITKENEACYNFDETLYVKPVNMNRELVNYIEESCKERQYLYEFINSGAGHDSLVIGEKINTAMIFVPSKNGRSHCKEEFTEYEHLKEASLVAYDLINKINKN